MPNGNTTAACCDLVSGAKPLVRFSRNTVHDFANSCTASATFVKIGAMTAIFHLWA